MRAVVSETNARWTSQFLFWFITVAISVMAVIGLSGVLAIRSEISKMADKYTEQFVKERGRLTQAAIYGHLSYWFYRHCSKLSPDKDADIEELKNDFHLSLAIESASMGLNTFTDEKIMEKTELECQVKNNLVYYWALKGIEPERALAYGNWLSHQADSLKIANKWYSWKETYAFALWRLGGAKEKIDAQRIIEDLCNDPTVPLSWRRDIFDEYQIRFNGQLKTGDKDVSNRS